MNTNTTATRTRTSGIASVWADVRRAQRRLVELNRPGTPSTTGR